MPGAEQSEDTEPRILGGNGNASASIAACVHKDVSSTTGMTRKGVSLRSSLEKMTVVGDERSQPEMDASSPWGIVIISALSIGDAIKNSLCNEGLNAGSYEECWRGGTYRPRINKYKQRTQGAKQP